MDAKARWAQSWVLQGGLRSVSSLNKTLTTARKADGEVAWS
jgi:hypothetical protein